MMIDAILDYVKRTNPTMTKDELLRQLNVSQTSTLALTISVGNLRTN